MLPRLAATWSCAIALTIALSAQSPPDVTGRRVPFRSPELPLPLTSCGIARAVSEVAWALHMAIGYEALSDEPCRSGPPQSTLSLAGLTLREILDAIVTRQPRYRWALDDGVIHLRPTTAIDDPADILNRPINQFVLNDATLTEALHEIHFALRPESRQGGIVGSGVGPLALGRRKFGVSPGRTTILGALDAIVKAHGASSWSVTWEKDPGVPTAYRISFHTFDGWSQTW